MFSPTPTPRTDPRNWRDAVRRAVDLAVAFATLADELGDDVPHGSVDHPALHPHRAPLRAQSAPRRPGAGAPRPQHCLTPLDPASAHPSHPQRNRRRTTHHTVR
jgi:hypothetical protein